MIIVTDLSILLRQYICNNEYFYFLAAKTSYHNFLLRPHDIESSYTSVYATIVDHIYVYLYSWYH